MKTHPGNYLVLHPTGGRIAKKARLELEAKTGHKVVTPENYLPPTKTAKQVK